MKELNNGSQFIDQTDEIDRIEEILYYDCLTPTTHYEIVKQSLLAGKDVFVEKCQG